MRLTNVLDRIRLRQRPGPFDHSRRIYRVLHRDGARLVLTLEAWDRVSPGPLLAVPVQRIEQFEPKSAEYHGQTLLSVLERNWVKDFDGFRLLRW